MRTLCVVKTIGEINPALIFTTPSPRAGSKQYEDSDRKPKTPAAPAPFESLRVCAFIFVLGLSPGNKPSVNCIKARFVASK